MKQNRDFRKSLMSFSKANHPLPFTGEGKKNRIMIKTVPDPTLMCEGCVYDGKFECIQHACCADPSNPVKYIEVEE